MKNKSKVIIVIVILVLIIIYFGLPKMFPTYEYHLEN